jgi:hypothetical protein
MIFSGRTLSWKITFETGMKITEIILANLVGCFVSENIDGAIAKMN